MAAIFSRWWQADQYDWLSGYLAARGIAYLASTQGINGEWTELPYTAVGFPRVFYLRYHGYKLYFPLLALARYRRLMHGNMRRIEVGF